MIQIKISANDIRETVIEDENQTIRNVVEKYNIPYATTQVLLDGSPVQAGNFDKTFKDMNITTKCIISTVVKTNNA